ncbi:Receptor-like kinase [Quillaja saponaria]|uniref:Receptor-like kinase n=1 Tax=Quillaja saponaria TaxID=32244 RepID=A0AAD7PRF2_QUISA|nr:Receptor-like kinase [Quillaja saponaria]
MESPLPPSDVIMAYDATKDLSEYELKVTVKNLRLRGDILRAGDRLLVLGVMDRVPHPMGYQTKACPESFAGTSIYAMKEEVSKKLDAYESMLLESAENCEKEGVSIEVKVTAGYPIKQVILQQVIECNAAWVVLDRHLRRDLRFYSKQIPCKVALIQDSFSRPVRPSNCPDRENIEHSVISCKSYSLSMSSYESSDMLKSNLKPSSAYRSREKSSSLHIGSSSKQEKSGLSTKGESKHQTQIVHKQSNNIFMQKSSDAPILCAGCGTRTELSMKDSMSFSYSQIQLATNKFSDENLIGEGGYGHVYKGLLKDGQLIAAKVRKEESAQGFVEFHSEIFVLNFARHKNIVMLLGYCCKESLNILVYEYICNKSLDWHLFDKSATILDWHQRYAIAIGTAKGLRFLHDECRGGPIIHRDMRPSNILLTHDFVPMLGDFGLAKWKISDNPHTRILGTLGYLAPEYAEDGIVSVRTDVYAYGIVLLQLISGRKVIDSRNTEEQQSLRQWAEPLIERLALHELIDTRLGESYDTYELYIMAKAAYFCVQRNPEMRPSMGEVVRLFEGENDRFQYLKDQVPHYNK